MQCLGNDRNDSITRKGGTSSHEELISSTTPDTMAATAAAETRTKRALHAHRAGSTSAVWGYVIVLGAAVAFLGSMYTMFLSKLPALVLSEGESTRGSLLQAIEDDLYYCFLLPLTIPVSILAFYANWVSLKFFRHN